MKVPGLKHSLNLVGWTIIVFAHMWPFTELLLDRIRQISDDKTGYDLLNLLCYTGGLPSKMWKYIGIFFVLYCIFYSSNLILIHSAAYSDIQNSWSALPVSWYIDLIRLNNHIQHYTSLWKPVYLIYLFIYVMYSFDKHSQNLNNNQQIKSP